jgi:hypothetical protein
VGRNLAQPPSVIEGGRIKLQRAPPVVVADLVGWGTADRVWVVKVGGVGGISLLKYMVQRGNFLAERLPCEYVLDENLLLLLLCILQEANLARGIPLQFLIHSYSYLDSPFCIRQSSSCDEMGGG